MTRYLLDTNVVSELKKPRPNVSVVKFVADQPLNQLYLSSITLAEIRFGIELLSDSARRADIGRWLNQVLRPMFEGRVLDVDEDVLLVWRQIIEAGRKRGRTFSHPDVLIAAIGVHHGITVTTRNFDEFAETGASVFDPWKGRSVSAGNR